MYDVGDIVKNTTSLAINDHGESIPPGSIGRVARVDVGISYPLEIAFDVYTKDTYPTKLDEIEMVKSIADQEREMGE